jgi:hypothetical protein
VAQPRAESALKVCETSIIRAVRWFLVA